MAAAKIYPEPEAQAKRVSRRLLAPLSNSPRHHVIHVGNARKIYAVCGELGRILLQEIIPGGHAKFSGGVGTVHLSANRTTALRCRHDQYNDAWMGSP